MIGKRLTLTAASGPVAGHTVYVNPAHVALIGPESSGGIGVAVVQLATPGAPALLVEGSPTDVANEVWS